MPIYHLIIFFTSIIFCLLLIIPTRKYAIKKQILDYPDEIRKFQKTAVPYLGGVAIIITSFTIFSLAFFYLIEKNLVQNTNPTILVPLLLMLGILGHIDDLYNLSIKLRIFIQIVIAFAITTAFASQNSLVLIFDNNFLNILVSTFWIIMLINAINFIDNTDAAAAGSVIIICTGLLLISLSENQLIVSTATTIIIGSSLGFLFWNWPPARIYLGDSGALFLGGIVALISIKADALEKSRINSIVIILTIFAFPILDLLIAVISRILKRQSPFKSGSDHFSHRLIRLGFSKLKAVYIVFMVNLYFVASGVLIYYLKGPSIILLSVINLLVFLVLLLKFLSIRMV